MEKCGNSGEIRREILFHNDFKKNKIKIFSLFILVFTMLNINLKQTCFNDTNVVNAYDEVTNYYSSIDFNQTGLALRS
ncbi:hypothetical protein, partial [uncultured Dialister sp.]|uniref:hypothetical protein n=1 Tax=uncultured Dialister sp. TaxID=278064 RepID=UPI0026224FCF